MRFRIVFVRKPTRPLQKGGKKGHLGPFQGPLEVGQRPYEVESEQRSAYKVVVLGQEMDLDKHN